MSKRIKINEEWSLMVEGENIVPHRFINRKAGEFNGKKLNAFKGWKSLDRFYPTEEQALRSIVEIITKERPDESIEDHLKFKVDYLQALCNSYLAVQL